MIIIDKYKTFSVFYNSQDELSHYCTNEVMESTLGFKEEEYDCLSNSKHIGEMALCKGIPNGGERIKIKDHKALYQYADLDQDSTLQTIKSAFKTIPPGCMSLEDSYNLLKYQFDFLFWMIAGRELGKTFTLDSRKFHLTSFEPSKMSKKYGRVIGSKHVRYAQSGKYGDSIAVDKHKARIILRNTCRIFIDLFGNENIIYNEKFDEIIEKKINARDLSNVTTTITLNIITNLAIELICNRADKRSFLLKSGHPIYSKKKGHPIYSNLTDVSWYVSKKTNESKYSNIKFGLCSDVSLSKVVAAIADPRKSLEDVHKEVLRIKRNPSSSIYPVITEQDR